MAGACYGAGSCYAWGNCGEEPGGGRVCSPSKGSGILGPGVLGGAWLMITYTFTSMLY